MKILVVSNFYPPHFIGGYELGCRDVVEGLRGLGHDVRVLTSTHGVNRLVDDGHVFRWLTVRVRPPDRPVAQLVDFLRREVWNQKTIRQFAHQFQPDLIYVWCPYRLSLSAVLAVERVGIPVCYFVSDHWPVECHTDTAHTVLSRHDGSRFGRVRAATLRGALRALGATPADVCPRFLNVQFASRYLRDRFREAGYTPDREWVIHWGVDVERLPPAQCIWPPRRFLYAGQLMPHKGVHTAVEAFRRVAAYGPQGRDLTLTLVGGTSAPEYEAGLRASVRAAGLGERVRFTGQLSRDQVAAEYARHDALFFPSEWDEPFSISLLEAMASGLAVMSTATGGTAEVVKDGVNAVTYPAGDAAAAAAAMSRLLADESLYDCIRRGALRAVVERHTLTGMLAAIDYSLRQIAPPLAPTPPCIR